MKYKKKEAVKRLTIFIYEEDHLKFLEQEAAKENRTVTQFIETLIIEKEVKR